MISMSSWCAEIARCVVRARAASGATPSGTKRSALELWNRMIGLLDSNCGQAGGRNGLAVALFLLAGDVKTNVLGHLGELLFEDLLRQLENQVPTNARHHAAQHQEIADVVEIGAVGDGVAEPDADGFVDLARTAVARDRKSTRLNSS